MAGRQVWGWLGFFKLKTWEDSPQLFQTHHTFVTRAQSTSCLESSKILLTDGEDWLSVTPCLANSELTRDLHLHMAVLSRRRPVGLKVSRVHRVLPLLLCNTEMLVKYEHHF